MPIVSSDGFRFYETGVERTFGRRIHYGQVIKTFDGMPAIDGMRRYSPGTVVTIGKRTIVGRPPLDRICTSHIERQNLSVRMAQRRFTRLTNGFSKKIENHSATVRLCVAHYNFCRPHETIRTTPAFAIGVANRVWTEAALKRTVEPPGRRVGRFRVIDGDQS